MKNVIKICCWLTVSLATVLLFIFPIFPPKWDIVGKIGIIVIAGAIILFRKKGGHFSAHDVKNWAGVAVYGGIFYVLYSMGGCLNHMATEHPCPFTAPNAVAEARARVAEVQPVGLTTGITKVVAPVDNWSHLYSIPSGGHCKFVPVPVTAPLWIKTPNGDTFVRPNEDVRLTGSSVAFRSGTNNPVEVWIEIR
jgi:hypothetical protein